jgi:hypothetical protein
MRIDPKNLKGAEDQKGKKITDPKDPAVLALAIQKYKADLPLQVAEICAVTGLSRAHIYKIIPLRKCAGRTVADAADVRALLGQSAA